MIYMESCWHLNNSSILKIIILIISVFKQLHVTIEKLNEYENKLKLYEKKEKIEKIKKKLNDKEVCLELENLF